MQNELDRLIQNKYKFIDLRSEKEFKKGSIPNSINLPILSDIEHESVGVEYKKNGQKSAINLGHNLVSGEIKKERVKSWCDYINKNINTKIFCYRGGLRSQIALKWIEESGVKTSLIPGGYKKIRAFCIDIIQIKNSSDKKWVILGGNTGSGKTDFLLPYKSTVNLEGIANHRGSAFGKKITGQPTASDFENKLAIEYLKNKSNWLLLEDESRLIGKNILHENWYQKMQTSDLIILKVSIKQRIDNIYREYISDPLRNSLTNEQLFTMMRQALFNIKKRLGGQRYGEIYSVMEQSFKEQNEILHKEWIEKILKYYYDPMYNYKMEKREKYITFRGTSDEVKAYLKELGIS